MAGPDRIVINFGAETREVELAGRTISDVLSDTEKALEDVGAAGQDSLADVVDAQGEVTRTAEDMGDAVEDAGERSGDALEDIGDKTGEVGDALGDLGGVAQDALDGDFSSAAEGGLGALAGLSAAIPGVGAVVGTVFAEVGKTIIGSFEESAEKSEERIQAMYLDFAESGSRYLTNEAIIAGVKKIADDADLYAKAIQLSKDSGVDLATVLRGMAGDGDSRLQVENSIRDAIEKQRDAAQELFESGGRAAPAEARQRIIELEQQLALLNGYTEEQDEAYRKGQVLNDAIRAQNDSAAVLNDTLATPIDKPVNVTVEKPELDSVFGALQADADARPIVFRARAERERVL